MTEIIKKLSDHVDKVITAKILDKEKKSGDDHSYLYYLALINNLLDTLRKVKNKKTILNQINDIVIRVYVDVGYRLAPIYSLNHHFILGNILRKLNLIKDDNILDSLYILKTLVNKEYNRYKTEAEDSVSMFLDWIEFCLKYPVAFGGNKLSLYSNPMIRLNSVGSIGVTGVHTKPGIFQDKESNYKELKIYNTEFGTDLVKLSIDGNKKLVSYKHELAIQYLFTVMDEIVTTHCVYPGKVYGDDDDDTL